jgi:hypothetical protein
MPVGGVRFIRAGSYSPGGDHLTLRLCRGADRGVLLLKLPLDALRLAGARRGPLDRRAALRSAFVREDAPRKGRPAGR